MSDDDSTETKIKPLRAAPLARLTRRRLRLLPRPTKKGSKKPKRTRKERYYARDPDAMPPTSVLHRIGRGVAATYYFVSGPTGIFALRMCIATFAVWIPMVIPSSAYFVYQASRHLGVDHGSDGCGSLGWRAHLHLCHALHWHRHRSSIRIRSVVHLHRQRSRQRIGLAATTAVGFIPLVFARVWAPKMLLLPVIMLNVSVVLVTGYSFIDTHLQVLANSGIGIDVAWKRTLWSSSAWRLR